MEEEWGVVDDVEDKLAIINTGENLALGGVDKAQWDTVAKSIIDHDRQLAALEAVVGNLEVVSVGAIVSVDRLHEHGLGGAVTVSIWHAINYDVAPA